LKYTLRGDAVNTNISFEIFPPRKAEALENIDLLLEDLCGHKPEYISVTYGAGGTTGKNTTLGIAQKIIHTYKTPSMVHLTCLYQTKADIAFLCDQFAEAGIKNVLALRGDRQEDKTEHGDFLYASDLVHFLKERYDFTIWAACYPEGHTESKNLDDDVSALAHKVSCGVDHLISQLFFSTDAYCSFLEKAGSRGITIPIDAGIMPVLEASRIKRMVSMSNAKIPSILQNLIDRYEGDPVSMYKAGIEYAVQQINDIRQKTDSSVHLYVMNKAQAARDIINAL
jgi:methylenetetrahydrofolate reductase (NADPH)